MGRRFLPISLLALTLACSSPRQYLERAAQLHAAGKHAEALELLEASLPRLARDKAQTAQALVSMSRCLAEVGRPVDAFSAAEKAVAVDPSNFAAHVRLADTYLASGIYTSARDHSELALRLQPDSAAAQVLYATALAGMGELEPARVALEGLLRREPANFNAAVLLADVYLAANSPNDARAVLLRLTAAQPGSAEPWLALARLEEHAGTTQAAENAYRAAVRASNDAETNLRLAQFLARVGRLGEVELVLRRVDALRPELPTALADFEAVSGRVAEASERYAAVLDQQPAPATAIEAVTHKLTDAPDAMRARGAIVSRLVEAALESGGVDRARIHLASNRETIDPATLEVLEAEIALAAGDSATAERHARAAVEQAPRSPAAHYVLGLVFFHVAGAAEAEREWAAALEQDPAFVPALVASSARALEHDDAKTAHELAASAVRQEPGNARALVLFARALLRQEQFLAAAVMARRARQLDPDSPAPYLVLGEVALRQDRLGEALLEFQKAILQQPESPAALHGLLEVYRRGEISRSMLLRMERIAGTPPASAALMEIAGRLYAQGGWQHDARRALKRAVDIDPRRSTAATALARLLASAGKVSAAARAATHAGPRASSLLLAFGAQQRRDAAAAIRYYEDAVRQGDHSGVAANNLAWLYAERGIQLERALELASQARTVQPRNPAVLDTLGLVHLRRREYSQAVSVLEEARQSASAATPQPTLKAIRRHLAEAYLRSGLTEEARKLR